MGMWTLAKVSVSLFCGGIFYSLWLCVFLLAIKLDSPIVENVLRLIAPIVTAFGFAVGIVLFSRWRCQTDGRFFRILMWPLVGCAIGAGAVWPFGPMLIVFGMLAAGTASVIVREAFLVYRRG